MICLAAAMKGMTRVLLSNTGRRRLNITQRDFFDLLRQEYSDTTPIHLFLDNVRYWKCCTVQEYAKKKNIILEYLPPYSPNLNLIERFWKFTKKVLVRNQYYETFDEFKGAFTIFFTSLDQYQSSLETLLTLKFESIGNY